MTTFPKAELITEKLRGIQRDVGEVIATMHYEGGQPVTFLDGSQIERCYDTLSDVSIRLRKALAMAEALPNVLSTLEFCLEFLLANDDGEDDVVTRIVAGRKTIAEWKMAAS
jgi:hypothetical protein